MTRVERRGDPEGADLKRVPPQETGRTLVFIGGFMVFCSLIALWWTGWDIRAGGMMMQALSALLLLGGLALMLVGYSKRNKRS